MSVTEDALAGIQSAERRWRDDDVEDGGLAFSAELVSTFRPNRITEVSHSGLLAERGPDHYKRDLFHDRRAIRGAYGHCVCEWHLHRQRQGDPPDVGRPSENDQVIWSAWRDELELRRFIGLIAVVTRDGSLSLSPWVIRDGVYGNQTLIERALLAG